MHRKLPICVFLIFAFVFAFIGCSFQSSGSPSGKDAGEEAADTKEASSGIGNAKAAGKKAEAGGRATVQTCLVGLFGMKSSFPVSAPNGHMPPSHPVVQTSW